MFGFGKNLVGEEYGEEESLAFAWAFLFLGISLLAMAWATIFSLKYNEYRTLNTKGKVTTAQIVKRIRLPQGGRPPTTHYFFTYQYTNSSSSNDCARSGRYFTTSRKQACNTTVQSQQIVEEQYDAIKVGDLVDVLYLPNVEKTKSIVIGKYSPQNSYIAKIIASLLVSLLFGSLSWVLATAKRSA